MYRLKILFIGLTSLLLMTGCWDKVEIDNRAFIGAMAIDKFEPKEGEKESSRNRYAVTLAYTNAELFAGKGEGEYDIVYTATGENIDTAIDSLATRLDKEIYFRHTQAIIIGENVAKDERLFRETLDVIERSPQIGRKVHFMIARGKGKDVLNTSTKDQETMGLFIRRLMEKNQRSSRTADADFGYILRSLHETHSAIIPTIFSSKEDFKIAGCAVLKDFKMVGHLGELDTRNLMFMMDKMKSSLIPLNIEGIDLGLEVKNSKTEMKVFEKKGTLYTRFDIKGEGDLEQHKFEVRNEPLDDKYIDKIEKELDKYIENQIEETYKKIQNEFGTDIVQVSEYLRKYEPDKWEEVKDEWDEIYPKTQVEVHVDMKIRRVGVTQ